MLKNKGHKYICPSCGKSYLVGGVNPRNRKKNRDRIVNELYVLTNKNRISRISCCIKCFGKIKDKKDKEDKVIEDMSTKVEDGVKMCGGTEDYYMLFVKNVDWGTVQPLDPA